MSSPFTPTTKSSSPLTGAKLVMLKDPRKGVFFDILPKMYTTKGKNKNIDTVTMIIGLCMPIITVPQLLAVWQADSLEGVSLITWLFYTLQGLIFAIFGIKHKEKPLIFTYIPLTIIELGIVIGILARS